MVEKDLNQPSDDLNDVRKNAVAKVNRNPHSGPLKHLEITRAYWIFVHEVSFCQ